MTALLIAVLLGLAGYYAWRQVRTLRELRHETMMPPEDWRYLRNQAWRRLACSALMVAFAAMLAGTFFGIESAMQELVNLGEALSVQGKKPPLTPEQQRLVNLWAAYWIVALLILLGMLGIALYELIAIRRFARRHFRKLQADRRAMIERQAARLREGRNGHE
jgi:TRAP-type C4-dicarboxylate transport system permease small subunit